MIDRLAGIIVAAAALACGSDSQPAVRQIQQQETADSLRVVLLWGPHYAGPGPAPRSEVRWIWNGRILRHDTITSYRDTVAIAEPQAPGLDTIVVSLWDVSGGPPLFRHLETLDLPGLTAALRAGELVLDLRRPPPGRPDADQTPGERAAEPESPPAAADQQRAGDEASSPAAAAAGLGQIPQDADLVLDFDDPGRLGVTCGDGPCPFPDGRYRKHDYLAAGGVGGSGAIRMSWRTGMSIGFSPVWIDAPLARHFKLRYAVRQSAPMRHQGSAIKLLRLCSQAGCPGHHRIGTLESKRGSFVWYWDAWLEGAPVSAQPLNAAVPADNQWHLYEIEVDYRTIGQLSVTFWLDGVLRGTVRRSATRDLMATGNGLVISPMAEMYSCGPRGCSAGINTGEYVVDDFSLTVIP